MKTIKFRDTVNHNLAFRVCMDIVYFFNAICDIRVHDTRTELDNLQKSLTALYCSIRNDDIADEKITAVKNKLSHLPQKGEYRDADDATLGELVWLLYFLTENQCYLRVHYHGELCAINCGGFQFDVSEDVGKYLGIEDTYYTYVLDTVEASENLDKFTVAMQNAMRGECDRDLILNTANEIIDSCNRLLSIADPDTWLWVILYNLRESMIIFTNVADKKDKIPYDLFYDENLQEGITAYRRFRVETRQAKHS